jgi:5-methylcytosine-specific restriction enzyme A
VFVFRRPLQLPAVRSPRPGPRKRGYDRAWDTARAEHLAQYPICEECLKHGWRTKATVVDHHVPHRGDPRTFWARAQWRSMCTHHHCSWKARYENRGYDDTVGADGLPIDPAHPFNQPEPR